MTRRELIAMAAGAAGAAFVGRPGVGAQALGDTIGAARDLVYQALEQLSANATPQQVQSAGRFLKNALDQEPGFGDAHYYRHLCFKKLNIELDLQRTHLESAKLYESEALRDGRDPFVLAVPKIYDSLPTVGQKWALVVGVSRFQPKIGAPPLRFAANDADAFAALLRDPRVGRFPPDNVISLTNDAATTGAIKTRLNLIAREARPEDVVVVYVSTHGSPRAADLKQVSYLYTYDTDARGADELFGTALPMVEVSSIISTRCRAQRTVAIFDTCHSGSGVESRALSPEDMNRLREGAGRYVLSSCEPDQLSYEEGGHGFFTASLIEQLKARQGCIRMKELFASVQKDVSSKVLARVKKDQRPVMASSENSSEIILGAAVGGLSDTCTA